MSAEVQQKSLRGQVLALEHLIHKAKSAAELGATLLDPNFPADAHYVKAALLAYAAHFELEQSRIERQVAGKPHVEGALTRRTKKKLAP